MRCVIIRVMMYGDVIKKIGFRLIFLRITLILLQYVSMLQLTVENYSIVLL